MSHFFLADITFFSLFLSFDSLIIMCNVWVSSSSSYLSWCLYSCHSSNLGSFFKCFICPFLSLLLLWLPKLYAGPLGSIHFSLIFFFFMLLRLIISIVLSSTSLIFFFAQIGIWSPLINKIIVLFCSVRSFLILPGFLFIDISILLTHYFLLSSDLL